MNAKQKSNPEPNKDDFFHLTSYIWIVKDFQDIYSHMETSQFILSERFYSPSTPLTKEGQEKKDDNIWRFLLYPRGKVGVSKEHMSLFLFPLPNEYEKQRRIFYRQAIYRIEMYVNNNNTCTNITSMDPKHKDKIYNHITRINNKINRCGEYDYCELKNIFPDDLNKTEKTDLIFKIHFYYDKENTIEIGSYEKNSNESIIPSSSFENYFNDDSFSDITFKFNCGSEVRASRLVLAMKSSYFKALFQGNWKESKSPVISIKDVKYECFKRMIYFLYSGKLDNGLSFEELKDLYIEADVRDIVDLKREGSKRIVRLVDETSWDEILLIGWQTKNLEMKEAGLKFFSENWMNIKNSDKMNNVISNANFDWLDELYRAKLFGIK
ncbi:362_t:CDS:1 [Funneliformis geosporum]|uniref:12658_t:CDS:1 n=1 Tax=Funneliformis geosporum TaxID=1117311 RepID=A0A9W4ST86_9GLOM|nr:362_t:CDS:1 [Funneliformis geosporum]CAI2180733.1 12658_t:CDS:1 [Funneliformis geosporum]